MNSLVVITSFVESIFKSVEFRASEVDILVLVLFVAGIFVVSRPGADVTATTPVEVFSLEDAVIVPLMLEVTSELLLNIVDSTMANGELWMSVALLVSILLLVLLVLKMSEVLSMEAPVTGPLDKVESVDM